ncbi:MAG: hypothetical protein ABFR89_07500 [Actinomycetota bacterium]
MKTTCTIVQTRLPGIDSVDELGERFAAHVDTCLACQAEAARYRSLRRHLGSLAEETLTAPDTLVPAVVVGMNEPPVDEIAERRFTKRQAVAMSAAAGAAVVAAAGTAIVIGLRRAHRAA